MQPDMENIKNKIQENRDLVDRITTHIPGFKGYVEKAELYDADTVIRGFITDKIQAMKTELSLVSKNLVKSGDLVTVGDIDSLNNILERLYKKIAHADFGRTAGSGNMKVTDEDLNRVLEHDWRMITTVEEILPVVQGMATADSGAIGNVIRDVETKLREFERAFDERKSVLMEVM